MIGEKSKGRKKQFLILIDDPEYEERKIATDRGRIPLAELPAFLRKGLEVFFKLMTERGWKKLELSISPKEMSFADNQRVALEEITDRSVAQRTIRYIRNKERCCAKTEVIRQLSSEIGRTECEIAGLNKRIEELRLKIRRFEGMLAGAIQEAAVLSADFEVIEGQPPQYCRDLASLQIPKGRHCRRERSAVE